MLLIEHTQNYNECYNARKTCTTSNEAINKTCDVTDNTVTTIRRPIAATSKPEIPPIADLIWLIVFSIVLFSWGLFCLFGILLCALTQQSED